MKKITNLLRNGALPGSLVLAGILILAEWQKDGEKPTLLGHFQGKSDESAKSAEQSPGREKHPERMPVSDPPARPIADFRKAKRLLYWLYENRGVTFYCGCRFEQRKIFYQNCPHQPVNRRSSRAWRVEWEHIVPASEFGRNLPAWKKGHPRCRSSSGRHFRGRKCARIISETFRIIEADLYNLVPAIGEVNELRGNLKLLPVAPGSVTGRVCGLTFTRNRAEPDDKIKGFVARTWLYMSSAYPRQVPLTKEQQSAYLKWDNSFPPGQDEIQRALQIEGIQGNRNHFVMRRIRPARQSAATQKSGPDR